MRPLKKKISTASSLAKKLLRFKRSGKRIVFTNGCFDILHPGHVTYLENARKLGDILVIALNSDQSVRRLKGPSRPINTLKARQTVVAALESVDFVTSFSEDTPLKIIRMLKPDVLAKGGDWKVKDIVGSEEVLSWGGSVRSIKFINGFSTTKIIDRSKGS